MDGFYLECLGLATVIGYIIYQIPVCGLFVYQTDEKEHRWVNAGRVKDVTYGNRNDPT